MNKVQFLLNKVAEESAEIAQIALKAAQFGLDEVYSPIGISNKDRIKAELNDLLAVVEMLDEFNFGYQPNARAMQQKKVKVLHYLEYSIALGMVSADS